jgi:hypothetical protein
MTPPLRAVQSVDALLTEPELIHKVSAEEARTLVTQLAALLLTLSLRAREPMAPIIDTKDPAVWLSAEQVEQRFGLNNLWLMEHRKQLGALGIVARPSRKIRVYDTKRLARFLESRRVTANSDGALGQRSAQ